jgi:hypothetical protein
MNADRLLIRLEQLIRILAEEDAPELDVKAALGERTAKIDRMLFPGFKRAEPFHPDAPRPAHAKPLTSHYMLAASPDGSDPVWQMTRECDKWFASDREQALEHAREIIVRHTELYYDPSLLPVTYYRRQRRIAAFLDQALSPLLRHHVRRTGATEDPDLFLNEPIFYFKKEVRTRAYPKNKHGRVNLDLMRERYRLLLMHRTAA